MKKRTAPNRIFLDGRIIEGDEEILERLSPGLLEGRGVFETMRVYEGKIFALTDHMVRLKKGLRVLGIKPPYALRPLEKWLYQVLRLNCLSEASIRLSVWQEDGSLTRTSIVSRPIADILHKKYQEGYRAIIAASRHRKTKYSSLKTLDYRPFLEAFQEARGQGHDEAVLLNSREELVEGSRTNIFYARNGVLYTPPLCSGCLNGITRRYVMRCARQRRIACRVMGTSVEKLLKAEEAFLTNSILEVMPLTRIDRKKIGEGRPGPLTQELTAAYRELVRKSLGKNK